MKYFSQLNKHTQAHATDLCHNSTLQTWLITQTSPTLYYSTYHSLHIQYLHKSSWRWTHEDPKHVELQPEWTIKTYSVKSHCVSRWTLCTFLFPIFLSFINVKYLLYPQSLCSFIMFRIQTPASLYWCQVLNFASKIIFNLATIYVH